MFQQRMLQTSTDKYLHLQAPLLGKVLPFEILGMLACMRAALTESHMSKLMYAQSRMTCVPFLQESFLSDSKNPTEPFIYARLRFILKIMFYLSKHSRQSKS